MMNIGVLGGTHLGQVTAACLASLGHEVTTYGRMAEVEEPGLKELRQAGITSGHLMSASRGWDGDDGWGTAAKNEEAVAAKGCTFLWCCQDTPVDSRDVANVLAVVEEIQRVVGHMAPGSLVLVSSQVPVGTTRELSRWRRDLRWAYSPENLRRGRAIDDFLHPARVVVGYLFAQPQSDLEALFAPFPWPVPIQWMGLESAECVKHALNALLGACIALTNEVAELAVLKGANPIDVERGLRSEPRIGPGLPVRAGEGFTGGTLGRDCRSLVEIGEGQGLPMTMVRAILDSNARHLGQTR